MPDRELFLAALDLPSADRVRFLAEQCADDPARLARVAKLLAAHEAAGSFLEQPIDPGPTADHPASRQTGVESDTTAAGAREGSMTADHDPEPDAGVVIAGKYKLLQQIGEGGMGTVWMADQTEPVKRRVAVKLIRADRGNSATILARFEAERQAIALMDHPHIAKLLDAGTESGRPFFVMELVKGVPLTEYCDTHRLSIPARLNLFMQICSAVQHAHQKGIIHRDLKPSNILVESHDGKPVPKVIDFGLAKATSGLQLTEHTLFTGFGSVMGTPLYMAPEQAMFNAIDIDTRADIYALGVILYELLTGTTPLTRESIRRVAFEEMLRLIREQEAPTPSSRLSSSEAKPTIAANRQTEPAKLGRFVKGDLDWITMKALSKDRDRRYETANGFAKDVERFLNHEPVLAGPPSIGYKLRKFVRRNRGPVLAGLTVLTALLLGIAGTTWQAVRTEPARAAEAERAEGERVAKEAEVVQRQAAEAATRQATNRLAQVKRGIELQAGIFADLDIDEVKRGDRPLESVLADRLTRAAGQLDGEAIGDPVDVATLQHQLASSLLSLGAAERAVPLFEKARATFEAIRGPDHSDTLSALGSLALAYLEVGRVGESIPLHEDVLRRKRTVLGPDHIQTLVSLNNLALAYEADGRIRDALPLRVECLRRRKATLGPDHEHTLESLNGLAGAYQDAGQPGEAIPLHEDCHRRRTAVYGPDHRTTLTSLANLAMAYHDAGHHEKAVRLNEECLKRRKAALGPDHPDTLMSLNNLGVAYSSVGRHADALPLLVDCLRVKRAKLGPGHPDTLGTQNNLAATYDDLGRLAEAIPLYEDSYRRSREEHGPDGPGTLQSANNLAQAYADVGRPADAVPLLEECLRSIDAKRGPGHPLAIDICGNLASAHLATGQAGKALPLFERWVTSKRKQVGATAPAFAAGLAQVARDLLAAGQFAAAEPYLRECLAIREKTEPDAWTTFNTQSLLGGALLGQKKYAEAEPLLLNGYEGMKAREKTIPPQASTRIPEALDRLIELYMATNMPDEVKKWRAERAKYPPETAPPPRQPKR